MKRKTHRIVAAFLLALLLPASAAGCIRIRIGTGETTSARTAATTTRTAAATTPASAAPTSAGTTAASTAATKSTTTASTTVPALPTQAGMYGNTNGNLANGGFAAYDTMTASVLLGIDGALLRHDPGTGRTETVLQTTGRPTHLNVSTKYYYFISSADGAFYRIGRDGAGLVKMADGPCTYAGRVNHYVQILQGGELALLYDDKDGAPTGIYSGAGILEPSLGSNRVYYISEDGDYRVSANNGQGRTTAYDGSAFQNVHHLFRTGDEVFAFVDRSGDGETVYTLRSLETPAPIAAVGTLSSIPSLNVDESGKRFYYVGLVSGTARLYRLDTTSAGAGPEEIARLDGSSPQICLAGDYVFVRNPDTGTLDRIDPDTGTLEPVGAGS